MIGNGDEFTDRMAEAINGMMLDMLAAIARKDYTDRRRRQAQGIEAARKAGKYRGRPEDGKRNADIAVMLREGKSWLTVMRLAKGSRSTVAKVARRMVESASACVEKGGGSNKRATADKVASISIGLT
jgi:DNA invertase Pin-like site-specific DNA recombinase